MASIIKSVEVTVTYSFSDFTELESYLTDNQQKRVDEMTTRLNAASAQAKAHLASIKL